MVCPLSRIGVSSLVYCGLSSAIATTASKRKPAVGRRNLCGCKGYPPRNCGGRGYQRNLSIFLISDRILSSQMTLDSRSVLRNLYENKIGTYGLRGEEKPCARALSWHGSSLPG